LQFPPFGHHDGDDHPAEDAGLPPPATHPIIEPPHEDNDVRPPADIKPTSPATDPDLSKTVYCSKPLVAGTPIVQYALMIDAGSTGSRIHIYKFNNCGASPEYEYEVFRQINPGLSSYKGRPLEAAQSLDVLLDEAMSVVPPSLQKCTPVAVKATAGLRLLGAPQSQEILDAVKHRIQEKYPFSMPEEDSVVIMDGSDEGVYAWITVNYLMNTIRPNTPANTPTYAVLDLGGASTQIVFKPVFDSKKPESTLEAGEHKYDLTFGGKTHVLYQHSYLGYGLMRARLSVHRLVDFMSSFQKNPEDGKIANPCLAKGTSRDVTIKDENTEVEKKVTMTGADVGSFEACNRIVQLVMAKDAYVLTTSHLIVACSHLSLVYASSNRARSTASTSPRSSTPSRTARSCSSLTSMTVSAPSSPPSSPPTNTSPSPRSPRSPASSAKASLRGRNTGAQTRRSWTSSRTARSGAST
jgi:guanosine-diphosphatase